MCRGRPPLLGCRRLLFGWRRATCGVPGATLPIHSGAALLKSLESLIETVEAFGCRHVCITGGEPLLQVNVHTLMKELCDLGYILSLETGGSLSIAQVDPRVHVILDVKCPDSAMSHKNLWDNIPLLKQKDEVKFVLMGEKDYLYAKEICATYGLYDRVSTVLFSPVHGVLNPQELVAWILSDKIPVRLNMQIHKFIWEPATRGV